MHLCMMAERTTHLNNTERKKQELISEDSHRQYVQQLQDSLLPDIQKNLEDFRWETIHIHTWLHVIQWARFFMYVVGSLIQRGVLCVLLCVSGTSAVWV